MPSRKALLALLVRQMPEYRQVTDPTDIIITRISGALTNCIFAVTLKDAQKYKPKPRKCLLRLYGNGVEDLFSRQIELYWFRILSELRVGPRLWVQFKNGRVEELLESETLTAANLRDPQISAWIAEKFADAHALGRMLESKVPAEFRSVLLWDRMEAWALKANSVFAEVASKVAERTAARNNKINHQSDETSFKRIAMIQTWLNRCCAADPLEVALGVLSPPRPRTPSFNLLTHLQQTLEARGGSPIMFCHNDAQYGNILRLTAPEASHSSTYSASANAVNPIVFIDYEYAGFNPRGFDLGNHFQEWTADYHSAQPHVLDPQKYPTAAERQLFLSSYLDTLNRLTGVIVSAEQRRWLLQELEREVLDYGIVSHLFWALWAIIQARNSDIDFDYLGYAAGRFELFAKSAEERFGVRWMDTLPA